MTFIPRVTPALVARRLKEADLSGYPTSNPGGGKPHLVDAGAGDVLAVGNTVLLALDANNTLSTTPTAVANERFGVKNTWSSPNSGQSLYPIYVNALAATDLPLSGGGTSSNAHGRWAIQLELTQFNSRYDCVSSIGLEGDGTTSPTNLQIRETDYDIGGNILSHEVYDKVHHVGPNASTHWGSIPTRVGWGYSSYSTNQGTIDNGVLTGIAIMDQVDFSSAYINPGNPSIGVFGSYFSVKPGMNTGHVLMTLTSKHANQTGTIQLTDAQSKFEVGRPLRTKITTNGATAAPYVIEINSTDRHLLYAGLSQYILTNSGSEPVNLTVQSADNTNSSAVQVRAKNSTSGVQVEMGVGSPTYDYTYSALANRGYVMVSGGTFDGLVLGSSGAKPIIFWQNGEVARFTVDGDLSLANALTLGVRTLATLPSAAASTGKRFRVSDSATVAQRMVFSSGSAWYYEGTAAAA